MNFIELAKKRCSVRKFLKDIPPLEDIKKIIDAARLAPSARNDQMWHFIAIYNENTKHQLKEAIENKFDELKNLPEAKGEEKTLEISKGYSTFFSEAPVTIAVLMKPSSNIVEKIYTERGYSAKEIFKVRPKPDVQSVGASIQNLLLAAAELDYGTCWMTAPIVAAKEMEKILKTDPEYNIVALIALGKPAFENKQAPKKNLEEILTIID